MNQLKFICITLVAVLAHSVYAVDLNLERLSTDDGLNQSQFSPENFFNIDGEDVSQYFHNASANRGAPAAAPGARRCSSFEGTLSGRASFYGAGEGFVGQKTFCGTTFTSRQLTGALRQGQLTRSGAGRAYKCGSLARVTNRANGRVIWVTLDDTGGLPGNRVIDLSSAAARELDFVDEGTTPVTVEVCSAG